MSVGVRKFLLFALAPGGILGCRRDGTADLDR